MNNHKLYFLGATTVSNEKLKKYILACRIAILSLLVLHVVFMVVLYSANDSLFDGIRGIWHVVEPIGRFAWGLVIALLLLLGYFQMQLKKNKSGQKSDI
jgi:hypothetical protein